MNYRILFVILPTLLTPLCAPRPCTAAGPGRAPDVAAIRQILSAYEGAWNRHDAHAFSLIFAPDAQFVNVRGIAYPGGRAGIERAHRPLFAAMFRDSRVSTDRVVLRFVRADVAAADVYWRMTGARDRSGRPRGLVRGLRNMVLVRGGGHWRIAAFHNMELDASPSEGFPKPEGGSPPIPAP